MISPEGIKIFCFDWSGTISDDRHLVYEANMAILRSLGMPQMIFEDWLPKTMVTAAEFLQAQGVQKPADELNTWYERELVLAKQRGVVPRAYLDAFETLSNLVERGLTVAVLSSHPKLHIQREAQRYALAGLITRIFGDSTDKADGLKTVIQTLGVCDAGQLLYCGDTVFDIQAAKAVGVVSAGICTGYHIRERLASEEPDLLLANLTQIRHWLEGREFDSRAIA